MIKNSRGVTAIELMIGVGILAISALIVFIPQIEIQKKMIDADKKAFRVIQINDLKQKLIASETSLTRSSLISPENSKLCPCTQGGSFYSGTTKVCTVSLCQANEEISFSFYDPKTKPTDLVKISGTDTAPVYYTSSGSFCPEPSAPPGSDPEKICGYKATTKFKAHCAGDLATCDHADYLIVTLELNPVGTNTQLSYEKTQILYTVPLNYNPKLGAIADQTLLVSQTKKVAVNADPGDPSEIQRFIFEQCKIEDPAIAELSCYKFINGVAQITLTGKTVGTTKVTLQINDGAAENSISAPLSFNVTVSP